MEKLKQNLVEIRSRIDKAALKSGRKPTDITMIAVSKTVDADTVLQAYDLGIRDFGENRVQQFKLKQSTLPEARWHLIGHLQTNKIKDVIGRVFLIHSLDRWRLAEELNKAAISVNQTVPVLLQVNISGEKQKYGLDPDDVEQFLEAAGQLKMIEIKGFMTMAPLLAKAEEARPIFKELALIKDKMAKNNYTNCNLKYLSMGMSQDFEVAVEEGANMVRIGSSLFGT
ncbi:MAG: YggS family pyridoxal phosphate-dependent enzyme [Syntrophomonadaceae bacterium]|jgi:pyridoxal phosphate enzyme (YggS family)|nr:YggS family pyridoxal phosphate-dependent enzyme [Syntrophomonadaceae bacterium]